jgi:Fe2+ transport system protein FeoA
MDNYPDLSSYHHGHTGGNMHSHKQHHGQDTPLKSFPLAMAGEGDRVKVADIRGGNSMQTRMAGMGIRQGDILTVVQRQGQGAVVVSQGETRYVLGGGMAQKINVIKE